MIKPHKKIKAIVNLIMIWMSLGNANALNTASIMASSASTDCIEYQSKGLCFWLFCTPFGCSIRTSVKVKHFIPEMVVSSYSFKNGNPWQEVVFMNATAVQGTNNTDKASGQQALSMQHNQINFKSADAIGHPQGAITSMMKNSGYVCKTQTTPFKPYFLSGLDALAWNKNIPEMFYPEALIPGKREVSKNGDNWGNIYPRAGASSTKNDLWAGGLIAQRTADIVSRRNQPHIYLSAAQTAKPNRGWWPPPPVIEGDIKNHKWQMLSPNMERSCKVFPTGDVTPIAEKQNYAWALWRPYECCKPRGAFLYSTDS